jgi:hypothetical protein
MFARATLGTSGSLLQGTRIQVAGNPPSVYEVAEDTLVGGVSATVPVQASVTGTGVAITSASSLVLLDPVYDNTWKPVSLTCADGTNFEKAADYRARFLQDKLTSRTGYLPNLVLACQNAGAVYVAAFPSSYGLGSADYANDFGLNAIYVADAGFSSNASLVSDCQAALEDWRVLGADLWVGGMTNIPLTMNFLVSLVDAPSSLPIAIIQRSAVQAILATFGTTQGGYIYSAHALQSAVNNSSKYIQTAAVPGAWAASTRYSIGDLVYAASCVQQCTESGESGLSVPSFSSVTGTVVYDGSASWKCTPHPSTGIFAAGVLQTTDPTLSSSQWPALLERYSVSYNNIRFNFTGPL